MRKRAADQETQETRKEKNKTSEGMMTHLHCRVGSCGGSRNRKLKLFEYSKLFRTVEYHASESTRMEGATGATRMLRDDRKGKSEISGLVAVRCCESRVVPAERTSEP